MMNRAVFFVALLAATATTVIADGNKEEVTCCVTCDVGFIDSAACAQFGFNDTIGDILPAINATAYQCKAMGYAAYYDGETSCGVDSAFCNPDFCHETGAPPNGDCFMEDDCEGDFAIRQTLSYCEENGFKSFFMFYSGGMCMSVADARMKYPKISGVYGDPHIKTWGGNWFDYHGECDLVLVHAPEFEVGKPLSVHVRTTIRYDYSFIEAAALAIGDEVLEVASFGQYSLNSIQAADLAGATLAGYPLYHTQISAKAHSFDVVLSPSENITITTFKDLVAVQMTGSSFQHFGNSTGIMGQYDGELVARDGSFMSVEVEDSANTFGQEWQVTDQDPMLFQTVRAPQYPQKCALPAPKSASAQRRLGETVTRGAAEEACSRFHGENKENCVFDVMAVGDLDMAKHGAY